MPGAEWKRSAPLQTKCAEVTGRQRTLAHWPEQVVHVSCPCVLCTSKLNNSGGPLTEFWKWGAPLFCKIEIGKGDPFARLAMQIPTEA